MKSTIYECLKTDDRHTPPMRKLAYCADSESEAILWLEQNGGGVYRNVLHNLEIPVKKRNKS